MISWRRLLKNSDKRIIIAYACEETDSKPSVGYILDKKRLSVLSKKRCDKTNYNKK